MKIFNHFFPKVIYKLDATYDTRIRHWHFFHNNDKSIVFEIKKKNDIKFA